MARYNWRKASIDEAIDRADKRKRRYTDKQRAAYWKKKYNECRRAHVAYVKRSK